MIVPVDPKYPEILLDVQDGDGGRLIVGNDENGYAITVSDDDTRQHQGDDDMATIDLTDEDRIALATELLRGLRLSNVDLAALNAALT